MEEANSALKRSISKEPSALKQAAKCSFKHSQLLAIWSGVIRFVL
jgi:hypothetical protein